MKVFCNFAYKFKNKLIVYAIIMNKKILQLALPSIVSNITVPLLGLVDVAIVGHLGAASYIGAIAVGVAGVRGRSLRPLDQRAMFKSGGTPSETRTPDTLIKSQVLYQLS